MNTFFTSVKAIVFACTLVILIACISLISCDGIVGFPPDGPNQIVNRKDWVINNSGHEIRIKTWRDLAFYREIHFAVEDTLEIPGQLSIDYLSSFGEEVDSADELWETMLKVPLIFWDSAMVVFEDGHSYHLRASDTVSYNFLIEDAYQIFETDTLVEYWFEFTPEDYARAQ